MLLLFLFAFYRGNNSAYQKNQQGNCYAAGDFVSRKTTTDVGGLNGRSGGISVDDNCYFNSEALQKQGDTVNAPAVAVGVNANDSALLKNVSGKTKAELGSDYFAHWAKGKN